MNQVPDQAELVRRVSEVLPTVAASADWHEENRRLHGSTVEALTDAGVFRMRVPSRFGGYECDMRTVKEVGSLLGSTDGSTAFAVALWWISSWIVGMFPDEVQDEVFANADVRVCGTLAPTATALPKEDGIVVNGRWGFNTGAAHSTWKLLAALLPTADGGMEPVLAVVPLGDVSLDDDWHAAGLRGTGSVTAYADDLFIPNARYLRIAPLLDQQYDSTTNRDTRSYRTSMTPTLSATTIGKIVGMGRGAQRAFFDRLPGRAISYTDYMSQRDAPVTHLGVAEAVLTLDEAEYHADRLVSMIDNKSIDGDPWSITERAYGRMAVGRVCQLVKSAVDTFAMASGASSIYSSVPIQRFQRDVQAVTIHGLNLPSTNLEMYGRVLCGLEPNTTFL